MTLQNATAGRAVNLGTESAGQLSITDTELDRITAGAVQVGGPSAGALSVSAAITPGATNTLTLFTGAGISETGTIVVTSLRIESFNTAILGTADNVSELAANLSASTGNFCFGETDGFNVGTVDGVSGIAVSTANAGNVITLNLSGTDFSSATQRAGANIAGRQLELLGQSNRASFPLQNPGNNVSIIAGNVSGLAYTDADTLTVGTAGSTAGIVAGTFASVSFTTIDGDLTISNDAPGTDISAGSIFPHGGQRRGTAPRSQHRRERDGLSNVRLRDERRVEGGSHEH